MGAVLEEIGIHPCFNALKQTIDKFVVAPNGNALIEVVEIVVVIDKAYRQALDNKRRQISALAPPLFLSITLDERFLDIISYQYQSLFLEVSRL